MAQIFLTVTGGFNIPPGIGRQWKPVIVAKVELSPDWDDAKEEARRWMEKFKELNPHQTLHGQITMSDWV